MAKLVPVESSMIQAVGYVIQDAHSGGRLQ